MIVTGAENGDSDAFPTTNRDICDRGMTKRELIAMHIMAGMYACRETIAFRATLAVMATDALLEELSK